MANIGKSPPRSLGRRLRSVAVAALAMGALGVVASPSHVAHAATMVPACTGTVVTPAAISGTFGVSATNANTGAPVTGVSVTGGSATLHVTDPNNSSNSTDVAFVGGVNTVNSGQLTSVCAPTFLDTSVTSNSLTFTINGAPTMCVPNTAGGTFSVTKKGNTMVQFTCDAHSDVMVVTLALTGGGTAGNNGTNTPELGSGELLATGLVPALGVFLYRRRRQCRAGK